MSIFTHVTVGANDLGKSRSFYDSVLSTLGLNRLGEVPDRMAFYGAEAPQFMVTTPLDGGAATHANGGTIGLVAPTRASVHAFHEAALANGGTCEGEPGPRPHAPTAYGAYVRDPDGNKLCAYCYAPE